MKKIGITGGIGSGKTTVCQVFKVLGVPVFHADEVAKVLQETDDCIRFGLVDLFGKEIYLTNGKPDRRKIAALIFNDSALKEKVNQLIHPAVKEDFLSLVKKYKEEDYIIYEAAILFETGSFKDFDYNILVTADEETRIQRVIQRDQTNRAAIIQRIKNQMQDEQKIPLADFIIQNDGKHLIIPQVLELDKIFRK
jgi:dephospho-CoA kinase